MIDLNSIASVINENGLTVVLVAYILFKDLTTQKEMIQTLTELRDLIKSIATIEGVTNNGDSDE